MFKKFYSFLNMPTTNIVTKTVDWTFRSVAAFLDLVLSFCITSMLLYALCGLSICVYYLAGQPAELAGAVAILAQIFPA